VLRPLTVRRLRRPRGHTNVISCLVTYLTPFPGFGTEGACRSHRTAWSARCQAALARCHCATLRRPRGRGFSLLPRGRQTVTLSFEQHVNLREAFLVLAGGFAG
jgi:hypothetical protein